MDQQKLSVQQFGIKAAGYLTSAVHATGVDLERLNILAGELRPRRALDVGCGAGHVSFALALGGVPRVTAYDPSAQMLQVVRDAAAERGCAQAIETCVGAAEVLPFEAATFDLVTTRYSAHHWGSVPRALAECARVLVPGGRMIVIDLIAPEIPLFDTSVQVIEFLRDASHVRSYRLSEWRAMYRAAGFSEPTTNAWKIPVEFQSWIARIGTPPERVAALAAVFSKLPTEVADYFKIAADHSFSTDAAWVEGSAES